MPTDSSPLPRRYKIELEPIGRRVEVPPGTNLLEAAQKAGVDLVASCGGIGICGTCRVRVIQGEVTPPGLTEEESLDPQQLAEGYRLACQTVPLSDVRLDIPPESLTTTQQMSVEGYEVEVQFDPAVTVVDLNLEPPDLQDLRSDLARVDEVLNAAGLPALQADLAQYAELSTFLRENEWRARLAVRLWNGSSLLVAVLPAGSQVVGLAMDMGSTKLALYLVDLQTGNTLTRTGVMNPQIAYGEDVVSRIAFANKDAENLKLLQTRLVDTINQALREMCAEVGISTGQVADVVAVGNTAMHHLFCGLPVRQLGAAPYVPVVSEPLNVRAREVGLETAPGAWLFLPSNIAGYVGADHVSALLATHSYAAEKTTVLVDIGTNTEISLTHNHRVYSCSTASGPAFEGAHIRDGMRAAPGAVDKVRITAQGIHPTTIADAPPVGICGSGILTAVSEMLSSGIIDMRGVLNQKDARVRSNNGRAEFLMIPAEQTGHGRDIVVNRKDVNEIQLAKGAIRAGINIMLAEAGITAGEVEEFVIAGAFGTYLDLNSALQIGMFPDQPIERYRQVGNAAGVGAKQMLISLKQRAEAARIVDRVNYVELTTYPDFTGVFVEAMYLKTS